MKKYLLLPFFALACAAAAAPMPTLPGMTQADLTLNLKMFDWGNWFGKKMPSKCGTYKPAAGGMAQVCMYGETTRIGRVVVNVNGSTGLAAQLLPYVATVPFEGSDGKAAKAWVTANLGKARVGNILEKRIGGAVYQLYGNAGSAIFMEVKAPTFEKWANAEAMK